ncbi:MAG: hypothetical protein KBE03_07690 [Leptotrichiaceae bacterium]|nr:hypothetical protein [Aliarcobacter sp.]MBP9630337.1 hypothetical protein [Leptotrichiaceae bacterium]
MKIKNKIIISFTGIFFLIFLSVGIVIYKNISKSIEKLTTAEVKKTLDVNSKALSFYIQGLINEQKELSKEAVFQEKDKTIITNFLRERIKDKKERFSTNVIKLAKQ